MPEKGKSGQRNQNRFKWRSWDQMGLDPSRTKKILEGENVSGAWEETKLVGHSVPLHTDNTKRDDAIMISMPPMTVLSPQDHKTKLKNSPITNSPRTHRTQAPLLDALAVFISSHHATLATYPLTLGVGWGEGHGGRHGGGCGCLQGIEGWIRTCIGKEVLDSHEMVNERGKNEEKRKGR